MVHLIATTGLPTGEYIANIFLKFIFKLHGLPLTITSDRGSQFTSRFWKSLVELLNIRAVYSTAHHHASNSQVELLNAVVSQTLCCLCDSEPSLWSYYLPFVEYAVNNSINSTLNESPFEVIYGYSLNFDPDVSSLHAKSHAEFTTVDWMTHFHFIRIQLIKSKQYYKNYAATSRSAVPSFSIGDYVWLRLHKSFKRGKFSPRRVGPYKITEILSPVTVKLDLLFKSKLLLLFMLNVLKNFSKAVWYPAFWDEQY